MKILAIEKEYDGKTVEDFQPHLEAESRQVWKLYKKGVIREIYFRADQTSAVLILECKNLEEAKKIINSAVSTGRFNIFRFYSISSISRF